MKNILLSMFAESFIHPGSGQNDGAVDQPVVRERVSGYPFIAGSSLKGAWRDYAGQNGLDKNQCDQMFGKPEAAGQLLVSDGRLLLLPVRSLSRSYCWLTCPFVLERLARDLRRALGQENGLPDMQVEDEKFLGLQESDETIFLEERSFQRINAVPEELFNILGQLIPHEGSRKRLVDRLVVVSDADFQWFAENGLTIQARNSLDDDKQSQNLWYEETLPPDTLMTTIITQRDGDNSSLATLKTKLDKNCYLQVGGNETIGQGWFQLGIYPNASEKSDKGGE